MNQQELHERLRGYDWLARGACQEVMDDPTLTPRERDEQIEEILREPSEEERQEERQLQETAAAFSEAARLQKTAKASGRKGRA